MSRYDDIIELKRPVSTHPKMSRQNRAAQFMPFAALTGYDDEIAEAGRLTEEKVTLTEEEKTALDRQLHHIIANLERDHAQSIAVTYFVPEIIKEGGSYSRIEGNVRKIDLINQILLFDDQYKIPLKDIIRIDERENYQTFTNYEHINE